VLAHTITWITHGIQNYLFFTVAGINLPQHTLDPEWSIKWSIIGYLLPSLDYTEECWHRKFALRLYRFAAREFTGEGVEWGAIEVSSMMRCLTSNHLLQHI